MASKSLIISQRRRLRLPENEAVLQELDILQKYIFGLTSLYFYWVRSRGVSVFGAEYFAVRW